MHIATGLKNSVLIFLVFGLLFGFSTAQNCALPQSVVLSAECYIKTECAPEGTILARLPTKYVNQSQQITQFPENYALVKVENDEILLIVNRPLNWKNSIQFIESYIDATWKDEIEIDVVFSCMDGNSKTVHFMVPIHDENTAAPYFEYDNYTLTMGPCFNGTHNGRCPLNFETPIRVFDQDRDMLNAEIDFYIDEHYKDLIKIEIAKDEFSTKPDENMQFRHQKNVHLYLQESKLFSDGDELVVNISVFNTEPSSSRQQMSGSTLITIFFGQTDNPGDNETRILEPPLFTSRAYHAIISTTTDIIPGSALEILPKPIFAYSPSTAANRFGYGDEDLDDKNKLKIKYSMYEDIFEIEEETGIVRFKNGQEISSFSIPPNTYLITARIEPYDFLSTSVPLVVFFESEFNGNSTTSPPNGSTTLTTPTPCADCPVECTPTEVTCPVVTQEPCPGSTTTTDYWSSESTSPVDNTNPATSSEAPIPTTSESHISTEFTTESHSDTTEPIMPTTNIHTTTPTISTTADSTWNTEHLTSEPSTSDAWTSPVMTTTPDSTWTTEHLTSEQPTSDAWTSPKVTSTTTEAASSEPIVTTPWTASTSISTTYAPTTDATTATFPWPTSTSPATTETSAITDELTTTTTENESTTPETATEEPSCCDCDEPIHAFLCPKGDYSADILFPDPFDNQTFHACAHDGNGGRIGTSQTCASNVTAFCPNTQTCTYKEECSCRKTVRAECANVTCPPCEECLQPDDPRNVCRAHGEEGDVKDPKYCNIFHTCTRTAYNTFIDCPTQCGENLVYCSALGRCEHNEDACACENPKLPPPHEKCDLCRDYYTELGITLLY